MDRIEELKREIRKLERVEVEEKRKAIRKCFWCGMGDDENDSKYGWGPLIDFQLIVCAGEEGYSNVVRYACAVHCEEIIPKLQEIGFFQHSHGGSCMMEDQSCVGSTYNEQFRLNECPTPEDPYEMEVWNA